LKAERGEPRGTAISEEPAMSSAQVPSETALDGDGRIYDDIAAEREAVAA
jgi:hypothetical protein